MDRNKIKRFAFVLFVPIIVYIVFLILEPNRFGGPGAVFMIFQQALIPSISAWGLCFVMSLGLYDLSIGSLIILSSILGTKMAGLFGVTFGILVLFVVCISSAVLLEYINAEVYTRLRIPSLIVTIGMLMIYETFGNFLNGAVLPFEFSIFGRAPFNVVLGALTFILAYSIYNKTKIGMQIKAVGGSEIIAKNSGIDVKRVKILGFLLCGLFVGIASVMTVSYGGVIMPSTNVNSLLRIFPPLMGYFIGIALQRYVNIIVGIFIGGFTIQMIIIGMMTLGLPSTYQQVVKGLFLLFVVGIALNIRRAKNA